MSLNEKAEQAKAKIAQMQSIIFQMIDLCDLVLTERKVNGEILEYTVEQKQKIIQAFKPLKTQLVGLVEALP